MKNARWIGPIVLIILAGLLAVGAAHGASKYKGQDEFREFCKPCHAESSPDGEYTPMTLIQDQWERFFEKKYVRAHEGLTDPHHGDAPVLEVITPELLQEIRDFAIKHAADSEHPMTCG